MLEESCEAHYSGAAVASSDPMAVSFRIAALPWELFRMRHLYLVLGRKIAHKPEATAGTRVRLGPKPAADHNAMHSFTCNDVLHRSERRRPIAAKERSNKQDQYH